MKNGKLMSWRSAVTFMGAVASRFLNILITCLATLPLAVVRWRFETQKVMG